MARVGMFAAPDLVGPASWSALTTQAVLSVLSSDLLREGPLLEIGCQPPALHRGQAFWRAL